LSKSVSFSIDDSLQQIRYLFVDGDDSENKTEPDWDGDLKRWRIGAQDVSEWMLNKCRRHFTVRPKGILFQYIFTKSWRTPRVLSHYTLNVRWRARQESNLWPSPSEGIFYICHHLTLNDFNLFKLTKWLIYQCFYSGWLRCIKVKL